MALITRINRGIIKRLLWHLLQTQTIYNQPDLSL